MMTRRLTTFFAALLALSMLLAVFTVKAQEVEDEEVIEEVDEEDYDQEEESQYNGRALRTQVERSLQRDVCASVSSCAPSNVSREVIVLLENSDTLDPARFFSELLDFTQKIWCNMKNSTAENKGALITFGADVTTQIPFGKYTTEEWASQVEAVRANSTNCCRGTNAPIAEAFRAARKIFEANPVNNTERIVILITDGVPSQITKGSDWRFPKVKPANYRYNIVPEQAKLLKNVGGQNAVELFVVGVANKLGAPFKPEYYSGSNVLGKKVCVRRGAVRDCVKIPAKSGKFPVSSSPAGDHIFASSMFDVTKLLELLNGQIC